MSMRRSFLPAAWLAFGTLWGAAASAQPAPLTPIFEVGGRVAIDRLTVVEAGEVRIRLSGTDTIRVDERTGLPPRVASGQAYRDVTYRFRLAVSPRLRGILPADSLLLVPPRRPDNPSPQ
jgi:hypothetical protein